MVVSQHFCPSLSEQGETNDAGPGIEAITLSPRRPVGRLVVHSQQQEA